MAKSLRTLQIKKTLSPGKPGTVRLVEKYGDDLLCVRYRYDAVRKRKVKTVELIVEEGPWEPAPRPIHPETIVLLHVEYGEVNMGRRIKAAGGIWNRDKRVWELPYHEAVALGITDRIVTET